MNPAVPSQTPPVSSARRRAPRIGLALAGGGPLGAMVEIGALAALEEAIEGLDLNDAAVYLGISAGGIIAAGLANGISPHTMCRLFIESDDTDPAITLFKPELLLKPAWGEWRKRAAALPLLAAGAVFDYARRGGKTSLANSFERLKEALPAGVFSGAGIDQFLRATFTGSGRTNDFRALKNRLILVATDLDSGLSVRFGAPGFDGVPISLAAQASAAVPGLFAPVEIDGRHYVDGVLRKTLHASIVLDEGVDLLICVNPIVPYNAGTVSGAGKIGGAGLVTVLSQALRAIIHSRVEIGMASYADKYPQSDILLFEPSKQDAELFFANLFSTANRRRICESAYQHTREMLWQERSVISKKLERHGLRLKLPVLRDTSLTLVKNPPSRKKDRFGTLALGETLDRLERHMKVAAG